jgi:hypothetical protein
MRLKRFGIHQNPRFRGLRARLGANDFLRDDKDSICAEVALLPQAPSRTNRG